jgi:hypothetical protein
MQSGWLTRYLDRMRPGSDRVQIADHQGGNRTQARLVRTYLSGWRMLIFTARGLTKSSVQ